MSDDIRIEITGDSSDIKKVVKASEKLVKRFEKANAASTLRRVNSQKQAANHIAMAEERKAKQIAAMERRLSRKRARSRLRLMKERVGIAKREAKAEERIKKRSAARMMKFAKFGAAGLGIGSAVGVVAGGVTLIKGIAKYERSLRDLRNAAHLTAVEELALGEAIDTVAINTGADRDLILDSIKTIQQGSGVILKSVEDVTKIGKLIRIMGEDQAAGIAETIAAMQLNFSELNLDFMELLETSTVVGQAGNFTLDQMADRGRQLTVIFQRLGGQSAKDWSKFNAMVQIFSAVNGSVEQTVTSLENFSVAMANTEKVKELEKAGLKLTDINGKVKEGTELLEEFVKWQNAGGNIYGLKLEKNVITSLSGMVKQQSKLNEIIKVSGDTAGEFDKQFINVQDTIEATLAIAGQLIKVLSQKAFKDFFKEVSKGLNEFLQNKEKMAEFVEYVKQFAVAMGAAGKAVAGIGKWFKDRETRKLHEKRINALLTNEFRDDRNRLIAEARKVAPDTASDEFQAELRRLTAEFYIENKLTFDETGKVKKQETNVIDQNNSDRGKQAYTTKNKGIKLVK